MKIYTKGGDRGRTSLVGGLRVEKSDLRVEAYGTLDELTAALGRLHDLYLVDTEYAVPMQHAVARTMDCGAVCAGAEGQIPAAATEELERQIDRWSEALPPLEHFTLPLGYAPTSEAHLCRTVCRRAERAVVRTGLEELESVQVYLNRLSDWLYVLGRTLMHEAEGRGAEEVLWHSNLELTKK